MLRASCCGSNDGNTRYLLDEGISLLKEGPGSASKFAPHLISNLEAEEFDLSLLSKVEIFSTEISRGKVRKKKLKKKLTSVSFMYVCVAENGEMLVFFVFFSQQ